MINTPPTDAKGRAAIPGDVAAFKADFTRAATYARTAGSPKLHVMSGVTDAPQARETLLSNLRWATAQAPDLILTIEPLNPQDLPGYFVNDFYQAARILTGVCAPKLKLQFDIFHAQMIHTNAPEVWQAVGQLCGHVQIASAPNRSEPDGATLETLGTILGAGYDGVISAEYGPKGRTNDTLGWMERARALETA